MNEGRLQSPKKGILAFVLPLRSGTLNTPRFGGRKKTPQAQRKNFVSMNILIIEDDRTIGKSLVQGFTESGYDCQWAVKGDTGLEKALSQQADVILLDLMLPEKSGFDILSEIRANGILTPVIVLTAKGAVDVKVAGFDLGADDYLVKPFAFVELKARVEAVCRRTSTRPVAVLTTGNLTLDLSIRRADLAGAEIDLTPTEFSILEMLMRHDGQVVTRKMLCEHVWGFEWEGPTNVIEVHITRLRKKLDRNGVSMITTVRGRGYSLNTARHAGLGM